LVGALLFVRSLQKLIAVDPGFRVDGILEVNLGLRRPNYARERLPLVYRELRQHLAAQPGVVSVAQVNFTPISGSRWNDTVHVNGGAGKESNFNLVGPGYFRTMSTTLLAGRDFDERDSSNAPKVAIVNEAFARRFFDGRNPIGHTFSVEAGAGEKDRIY